MVPGVDMPGPTRTSKHALVTNNRVVVVDDGESGEITLLAVRAKMFQMEKGTGWKERGAGMLKVNVPKTTIEINDHGYPEMSSFDASVLDDDENGGRSGVRLILRQDHTLRVILNTAIVPAMKFQLNQKLKAAYVLFTAFEGDEVKQVQMKVRPLKLSKHDLAAD